MAKAKTVKKFDFSGAKYLREPYLYVLELVKGDDVPDLVLQLVNRKPETDKYEYNRSYAETAKVDGWDKTRNYSQNRMLEILLAHTPEYRNAYNDTIMKWYNGHEGAQETYKAVAKDRWVWYKDNFTAETGYYTGNRLEGQELLDSGVLLQPRDYVDIQNVLDSREARTHIEVNREQIFIEGDLVVLRTPFVGRWDYDPTVRSGENKPHDEPRYGTVMEQGTGNLLSWRGAKGSRQVSVLWFGKDEITEVPEKIIKLECRKGRKV
jgi:hypothetical protein